jgi:hypothetical protein
VVIAVAVGSLAVIPLLVAGSPLLGGDGFGTRPFRPATLLLESLTDFHDGTGVLLYTSLLLVVLGVFGVRRTEWRVDLDLRTVPDARAPGLVLGVAMAFVAALGLTSRATLNPGAVAVFLPLFLVLAALGLSRFSGRTLTVVALAFAVLAAVSLGGVAGRTRSEADDVVRPLLRATKGPVTVLVCPAALATAVRHAAPPRVTVLGWPELRAPVPADALDARSGTPGPADASRLAALQADHGANPLYFVQGAVKGITGNECGAGLTAVGGADPRLVRDSDQEDAQAEPMRLSTRR